MASVKKKKKKGSRSQHKSGWLESSSCNVTFIRYNRYIPSRGGSGGKSERVHAPPISQRQSRTHAQHTHRFTNDTEGTWKEPLMRQAGPDGQLKVLRARWCSSVPDGRIIQCKWTQHFDTMARQLENCSGKRQKGRSGRFWAKDRIDWLKEATDSEDRWMDDGWMTSFVFVAKMTSSSLCVCVCGCYVNSVFSHRMSIFHRKKGDVVLHFFLKISI